MPRRQDLGFHQKSAAPRSPFLINFLENRGVSLPKAEDGLRHEALEKPNYGTSEWVVALSLVTVEGVGPPGALGNSRGQRIGFHLTLAGAQGHCEKWQQRP